MSLRKLVSWWILIVPVLAQAAPAPAEKPVPLRIHVIGASVSAGFRDGPLFGGTVSGDSVPLQPLLAAYTGELASVSTHPPLAMTAMFTDPLAIGSQQVQITKKRKPDLVVAVDFPFWFAYGYVGDQELAERQDRLDKGLAMLADLGVPVLVGDLPDMRGAAVRMLNPRQVPSPAVLENLQQRLLAYVAEHENLHLLPLRPFVAALKSDTLQLPLADGPLTATVPFLLQEDRLHATRLGMAYLGLVLQPHLQAALPKDHALRERTWRFEQFVEAAGAEGDLEALREAAAKAKDKGSAKEPPQDRAGGRWASSEAGRPAEAGRSGS